MTDPQWLDYVRSLIGESEATYKMWTPEEVLIYKAVGVTTVLAEFWNLLAVTHKKIVKCAKTKDDPYISLKDGENDIPFHKIIRIEYTSTGRKLDYIEDDKLFLYETGSTGEPQVWLFEDNKPYQVPTPAATVADYWRVWYLPEFTTLAELPDILHPLIALEAVINARIKDERLMRALLLKRDHLASIAMGTLAIAQLQEPGKISMFGDDEEEDD